MSYFDKQVEVIKAFWRDVFGQGPSFETGVALSVAALGLVYMIALPGLVCVSLWRAFR